MRDPSGRETMLDDTGTRAREEWRQGRYGLDASEVHAWEAGYLIHVAIAALSRPVQPSAGPTEDEIERAAIAVVNHLREEHHLPPITLDALVAGERAKYLREASVALSAASHTSEGEG